MPYARYCQTKDCSNQTETDHPHCPACEQAPTPRRLHRASSDAPGRINRARCATTGCEQRATYRANKCFDHQIAWASWEFTQPVPEPQTKGLRTFDIVCLQCAERRSARGTEADANYTRQHLGPCARCRGPLVVERSDLGGISSPVTAVPMKLGWVRLS